MARNLGLGTEPTGHRVWGLSPKDDRIVDWIGRICAMTPPVAGAADLSRPRSILDLVGNTPLLRLRRFERADGRIQLYAKAEWKNPGGSVKDRAAVRMVTDGEASGLLTPG